MRQHLIAIFSACAVAVLTPASASASDLKKMMSKDPARTLISSLQSYDIERCILEFDGPGLPFVYRQPDKPETTIIAYSQGVGISLAVRLTRAGDTVKVEIRTGGIKKVPSDVEACV